MDIHKESSAAKLTYFWIGIIAALAYRVIIVLNFYEPIWVKIAWYVGTIGFVIYFWSRYRVVKQFNQLIQEQKLTSAIKRAKGISENQREALQYLVETLKKTKAHINYQLIFLFSALALIAGVYLDVFA